MVRGQSNKQTSTLFRALMSTTQKGACGFSNHGGSRVHYDGEQPSSITHSLLCLPSWRKKTAVLMSYQD